MQMSDNEKISLKVNLKGGTHNILNYFIKALQNFRVFI